MGEQLEDDHLVQVVEREVNRLDRRVVEQVYRGSGSLPFDPIPLLKMVLYQYLKGQQSPACWFDEARLNQFVVALNRVGLKDVSYHRLAVTGHCPHSIQRVGYLQPVVTEFFIRTLMRPEPAKTP